MTGVQTCALPIYEICNVIIANYNKVQNPPVSKERFANIRDSLVMLPCVINADEEGFTSNGIFSSQFEKIFQSDAYTQFLQSYEGGLGQYGAFSFGTNYDLVMPGRVLDAGMGQYDGKVIHYRLGGERMIPGDYTIMASSRVINIWAFVFTILVILVTIGSFFFPKKRHK